MAETMLKVAAQKPETLFICIGSKAPLPALQRLHLLSVPYMQLPAMLADYYRAADVFVHTARAEAFGKTITEAMACATPVAATNIGGIPEQVLPGKTGFLAEPENAEEMTAAVLRILEMPPEEKARMDRDAASQGEKYPLHRQGEQLLGWYREIYARHRVEISQ